MATLADVGILFPPIRNNPQDVYDDGVAALTENLRKYKKVARLRGNKQFTVEAVNIYNKKRQRLEVLKSNQKLSRDVDRELNAIEKRIG